jgi:ribonuclease T
VSERTQIADRFRGFLPVVVDLETGGFNPSGDAILELAAVLLNYDGERLTRTQLLHYQVAPLPGTNMDPASLRFIGIDPYNPARKARSEPEVFQEFFREVRKAVKHGGCSRAIVVAHNAAFDHQFIMSGANRNDIKRNPFHPFSFIDTASLAAVAFGQTVLSQACGRAGIAYDSNEAHSARYDADVTAALFCAIVNRWQDMGGWPLRE